MQIFLCTIIVLLVVIILAQKASRQRYTLAQQQKDAAEVRATALMELLWEIHQEQLRARGILP